MIKKELTDKLEQYGGFHDSKVKRIFIETNHCTLGIAIDHAYEAVPSPEGQVVVPNDQGGAPKRYRILYRPMTIVFKDVVRVGIKPESDPVNEEIILSCQLAKDGEERSLGPDVAHFELLLSSLSRLDVFCRDFECKPQ